MAQSRSRSSPVVSDSEFYMWRAVFAFSLVDNKLSLEEQDMLRTYLGSVPFSDSQLAVLQNDFRAPQNVEDLYQKITERRHKERFCVLARALVWCEGNMERQEEEILRRVACLGRGEDMKIFHSTRNHPHIHDFYQHYARAGVVGLMRGAPGFQRHV